MPGLEPAGQKHTVDIGGREVVYDFYNNRAAASLHMGGALIIEAGTAGFAKYVDGSFRSVWHLARTLEGQRTAIVAGLAGELFVPIDGDPAGVRREADGSLRIRLRVRPAKKRQLVSVFLNENRLGDLRMPEAAWGDYSIRAPAGAVRTGENKLRFYFRYAADLAGVRTGAAIARIAVGGSPPTRSLTMLGSPVSHGGLRLPALRLPGAARLSYYVQIPKRDPELVFEVAGAKAALHIQIATATSGGAATVWKAAGTKQWVRHHVSLADHAGEVARIDLVSSAAADWGRPQLVVPRPPAQTPRPRKTADHVVVWVVSALRADRVAGRDVPTPNFKRFMTRATRFTRATAASSAPGPAHVALLTGRHPARGRVAKGVKTLAERFREAGYATVLISGNGFVNDEAGFARGFDVYRNPMRRRRPFRANILWQQARRFLQKHKDGHSFVYLATVEPHLPYTPSQASLAAQWDGQRGPLGFRPAETAQVSQGLATGRLALSADERAYIKALYDAEVRDADAAFGAMLADLDKLGLADRTAVILVADHGEELFERGGFGHGSHLYEEVLHVPLAIRLPGQRSAAEVDVGVELVDVYATALDLAGIATNPDAHGQSLLGMAAGVRTSALRPRFAYLPGRGRALLLGRYKFVAGLRGSRRLYDLIADPEEHKNLMADQPLIGRYMRNVFGIGVAYEQVWSRRRWGSPNQLSEAFAADHGL